MVWVVGGVKYKLTSCFILEEPLSARTTVHKHIPDAAATSGEVNTLYSLLHVCHPVCSACRP